MTTASRRRLTTILALALLAPLRAAAQAPVAPADVWGFAPGTDYRLANYSQIRSYLERLAGSSPRVELEVIGESTLGKPMLLAIVSSEANLRDRTRFKEISRRLAQARGLSPDQARALAREGKAVVWIDGGLHSTEVAHAQHTPELAHWLATSESEEARRIREEVITLIMPVMNPDGQDIVTSWYERNRDTPFATAPLVELYHHYAGHDNNRDFFMFTQKESQAIGRQLYHEWVPQILYNHHQSSPFPGRIFMPPFKDPVSHDLDPLVVTGINHLGYYMAKRFAEEGKPGVNTGIVFDMWHNGGTRGSAGLHNILGIFTETAGFRYAHPNCWDASEIPETFGARADHLPARHPSTRYTDPWRGGCWKLRDAMDYMMTASLAVLDAAAKLKEDYLYGIYTMGRRQTERGERAEGGPFAHVIDMTRQRDPGSAVALLRTLRVANIEVRKADAPFTAGGRQYPAGAYVIPPQAFRPYVIDLLQAKQYPGRRLYPGGPIDPPYDFTGYELPPQMGVVVDEVREAFAVPPAAVTGIVLPEGRVAGNGSVFLLSSVPNAGVVATNRLVKQGATVSWATRTFQAAGRDWPAGTRVVRNVDRGTIETLARTLGVDFHAVNASPAADLQQLAMPRIGVYKSHQASMEEGWTRWILDQYEFPFATLNDAAARGGHLSEYDVIIVPSQGESQILEGHRAGAVPAEYAGGLGAEGAAALRRYVENGGWLLAFDEATQFAVNQLGLPVRNLVQDVPREQFTVPGSLIRIRTRPDDPLAFGMADDAVAFLWRTGQVLDLAPEANSAEVPVRYAEREVLASGYLLGGDEYLAGKPAALRIRSGQGTVILLGFNPHFRGQPHNTFKLLFNPLYSSAATAAPRAEAAGTR